MERSRDLGSRFHLKRNRDPRSRFLLNITPPDPNQLTLPSTPPTKSSSTLPSFNSPTEQTPLFLSVHRTRGHDPRLAPLVRSSLHLQLRIRIATHPNSICVYNSLFVSASASISRPAP
ncbi:hypothetical protein Scep_019674 [Stephania cephalantha]|uniref:Uncharacterized protein n=1 Tax=Stephania cephalantha TaxID=152367 RepID=A0AAP0IBL8_9MAGN